MEFNCDIYKSQNDLARSLIYIRKYASQEKENQCYKI